MEESSEAEMEAEESPEVEVERGSEAEESLVAEEAALPEEETEASQVENCSHRWMSPVGSQTDWKWMPQFLCRLEWPAMESQYPTALMGKEKGMENRC